MQKQSEQNSLRDAFIIAKHKQGFSLEEIRILLEKENFVPITRQRVQQVIQSAMLRK